MSDKTWGILMKIGAACGCHQLYERSFKIGDSQFPLCARCTGILAGEVTGILLYLSAVRVPWQICVLFVAVMSIDGLIQLAKIKESTNRRRVVTGAFAGIGYTYLFIDVLFWIVRLIAKK